MSFTIKNHFNPPLISLNQSHTAMTTVPKFDISHLYYCNLIHRIVSSDD
eukprot:UN00978